MGVTEKGDATGLGALLDGALPSFAGWTDEQWAEHDERVRAASAIEEQTKGTRHAVRVHDALAAAGFPERALEWASQADESSSLIQRISTWDPAARSVLVLSGSRGCGKTVAATWWAMRRNPAPTFLRAATFARSSRYAEQGDRRDELLAAPAVVLDDLGEEFMDAKGSFLVDLDELVDVFYGNRKPLVITTNCDMRAFKARYGERIADRMHESALWFSANEQSRRRKS